MSKINSQLLKQIANEMNRNNIELLEDNCILLIRNHSYEDQLSKLPIIQITFQNGSYEWNPLNYMIQEPKIKNKFCLGIYSYNKNIFGGNFFQNQQFGFDIENKLATFVESNCSNFQYNSILKKVQRKMFQIILTTHRQIMLTNLWITVQ